MARVSAGDIKTLAVAAFVVVVSSVLHAQTPVERGKALMDARKYNEAKTVLEPVGSRDATAAFYLGQIAMEQSDAGKSVSWFEKAVDLNPRSSLYYDWLGRAYGMQAQRASKLKLPFLASKTKSAWEKSIALDPDNLDALLRHEAYAQAALPPAATWLPGSNLPMPAAAVRMDAASGDRFVDFRPSSAKVPSLWVVQVRGASGWSTEILPGAYRGALISTRGSTAPVDVRVSGVDRVGNLSPAARVIPTR